MMKSIELGLYCLMLFFGYLLFGGDFLWIIVGVLGSAAVMAALLTRQYLRWWKSLRAKEQKRIKALTGGGNAQWLFVWRRLTASDNVIWLGLLVLTCVVSIYALKNPGPSPYEYAMRDQPVAKAYVEANSDRMESLRNYAMGGNFAPNVKYGADEFEKKSAEDWNWSLIAGYLWFWCFVLFFPTLGDEVRTMFWASVNRVASGLDANAKIQGLGANWLNGLLARGRRNAAADTTIRAATDVPSPPPAAAGGGGAAITSSVFVSNVLANLVTDIPQMIHRWLVRN